MEKIKTVMFGDTEITITKNLSDEYFAEYDKAFGRGKIPCGKSYQGIWEAVSEELGGDDTPTGWELLAMADEIERTRLTPLTTVEKINAAVEAHLMESNRLWPIYVYAEIAAILDYRYGHTSDTVREKLEPLASIESWFMNAIYSKRIYRLETDTYEDQAVRIVGAHAMGNDYLVEFEFLEFGCDEDDKTFWDVSGTFVIRFSECTLVHKLTDELPPEYDEVVE